MTLPNRPLEITAKVAGKCQCCNTPYPAGARLRQEHRRWVLIEHNAPEQPRRQTSDHTQQWLMGRRNNTQP